MDTNTVTISVLGMRQAMEKYGEFGAVISIENADGNFHELRLEDANRQLVLAFNDIDFDDGGPLIAKRHHLEEALRFYRKLKEEQGEVALLVHCHVGRARSPAIALALIADELGEGREEEAVDEMLRIAPRALPNLQVLKLADDVLERHGKLKSAWIDRYEIGEEVERIRGIKREIYLKKSTKNNKKIWIA